MNADRSLIGIAAAGLAALLLHFLLLGGTRGSVDPALAGSKAGRIEQDIRALENQVRKQSASQTRLQTSQADRDRGAKEVAAARVFLNTWSTDLRIPPRKPGLTDNEYVQEWKSLFDRKRDAVLKILQDASIDPAAVRSEIPSAYDVTGLTPEVIFRKQYDKRLEIAKALSRLLADNHARQLEMLAFRRFESAGASQEDPYRMPRGTAKAFEAEIDFQMPWQTFPYFVQRLLYHPTIPFMIRHVQLERRPGERPASADEKAAPPVRFHLTLWALDFQPDPAAPAKEP